MIPAGFVLYKPNPSEIRGAMEYRERFPALAASLLQYLCLQIQKGFVTCPNSAWNRSYCVVPLCFCPCSSSDVWTGKGNNLTHCQCLGQRRIQVPLLQLGFWGLCRSSSTWCGWKKPRELLDTISTVFQSRNQISNAFPRLFV